MNSTDCSNGASALTRLLHAELRDVRFSVTKLAYGRIEFRPDKRGGHGLTSSWPEKTSEEELDAHDLKSLYQRGDWRRELFRFDIQVKALYRSPESTARLKAFEHLLDAFGVLSEGHVAHALGGLLPGYFASRSQTDAPENATGVSETTDLWSYLLVDACLTTPRSTANKVLRWVRGAPLAFEMRVLLGRLSPASRIAFASGLSVDRLPCTSDGLDGRFPIRSGVALPDYLDRTILRIPCKIAPVLSKPTKITEQSDGSPAVTTISWNISANIEATWPMPPGGLDKLTHALSLVCDIAVETPMIWIDYGDHAHFGKHFSSSSSGTGEAPPRTVAEATLTADDLRNAIRLQPKLINMPDSVKTAFEYWLKSKARRPDLADRMVFLRTALEALFLDDGNRTELAFRLATNGAWYTGRNAAERRHGFNTLKNIYRAASGAVHSGRIENKAEKLLADGQEICRQAILKRLRSRQNPVWEKIVFGR